MRYALSRIGQVAITVLLVSIVLFAILRSVPGDPAVALAGPDATAETIDAIRVQYGLDQPVPVQYLKWLGNVLTGDLGTSISYNMSVVSLTRAALPPTLQLIAAAMVVSLLIGIPVGVLAATRARKLTDVTISYVSALVFGLPAFWLGLVMLMIFSVRLGWVPSSGYVSFFDDPVLAFKSTILPAIALGLAAGLTLARFVRAAMLEAFSGDFVRTARAKGVSQRRVIWRHAFPNALVPTVTIIGLQIGIMLGGAVVVERVFTRPGVGSLLVGGITTRDYPLVQGVVLFVVVWYAVVNLLVDLSYGLLDPRIRR